MSKYFKSWETDTRYYEAHLYQDLFGIWIIDKNWGGKFNKLHGNSVETCQNLEDGFKKLYQLGKLREKRGYKSVTV